jgi:hypothetical protein
MPNVWEDAGWLSVTDMIAVARTEHCYNESRAPEKNDKKQSLMTCLKQIPHKLAGAAS